MKYHSKPHKKTEDKKSYITKIREEEQKKMDRLKKTNDKKKEDDPEKNRHPLSGSGTIYII